MLYPDSLIYEANVKISVNILDNVWSNALSVDKEGRMIPNMK